MLFPTHLLVAAVVGHESRLSSVWLVVGAAIPDVVDKPLGLLGIADLYHSVGHTALGAPLFVLLALSSRAGLAVAVGWGSHLLLDALHVVLNGRPGDALFLGWPLTVPPDPLGIPPGEFLLFYLWTPSFLVESALWGALALVLVKRRSILPGPSG
ncbi:hypothetical protein [Halococcus agarilyticus]|uniref:hypothetical protein n=1 Tax=Halococcus agarilyticus TaxID=1232219 RepID=UPI0006782C21|nr:hypothetical protein [Halococcus agarilyticus]